jgi:proteasome lid subunit RPN8/RPN11
MRPKSAMRSPNIALYVPRSLTDDFKAKAKAVRHEMYAYVVAEEPTPGEYMVTALWYPDDLARSATSDRIHGPSRWYYEAARYAKRTKAKVIGDIHSHPPGYHDHPSETDWLGHMTSGFPVMGVCGLTKTRRGLRARVKWYPRLFDLSVQYGD